MQVETGVAITFTGAIISGVVWAVRQEGRINAMDQRITDMKSDLLYIRERIDQALNGKRS